MEVMPELPDSITPTDSTSSMVRIFCVISSAVWAFCSGVFSLGMVIVALICVLSMEGISTMPCDKAPIALNTNTATMPMMTTGLNRRHHFSAFSYPRRIALPMRVAFCSRILSSSPDDIAGTSVSATIRLASSE